MADTDFLMKLQKQLADEGMLIGAGWIGFRLAALPKDAPPEQLEMMKMAFFAGSTHLFTAMMGVMDEGIEETAGDMDRMAKIHNELQAFDADFQLRYGRPAGSG